MVGSVVPVGLTPFGVPQWDTFEDVFGVKGLQVRVVSAIGRRNWLRRSWCSESWQKSTIKRPAPVAHLAGECGVTGPLPTLFDRLASRN